LYGDYIDNLKEDEINAEFSKGEYEDYETVEPDEVKQKDNAYIKQQATEFVKSREKFEKNEGFEPHDFYSYNSIN
jgi:hypothetical protein